MYIDLQTLLDNKLVVALLSAFVGGVLVRVVGMFKGRIQVLYFTVTHNQIGSSTDDPVLGRIQTTWNENPLSNLYNSTVTLANSTTKDLKDLVVKVFTGETKLLTQHVSIKNSTYIPMLTEASKLPPDNTLPTQDQLNVYLTSREYKIAVLNRGQEAVFHYLTTDPKASPHVFLEVQQEGLRAEFKVLGPEMHGVSLKRAIPIGLIVSFGILIGVNFLDVPTWLASTAALFVGWFATSIGAWTYKLAKGLVRIASN